MESPNRLDHLSAQKKALFDLLREKKRQEKTLQTRVIPRAEAKDGYPLSFAQQRLWFISQLEPDHPIYNIPTAMRLTGRLDAAALGQALSEVVRRHEVLRTSFAELGGQVVQRIEPAGHLALDLEDLGHLPAAEREAEARRLASEEANRPFDLSQRPPLRARLLRLDAEDHVLLFTIHHIAGDAWSTGVLIKELATLYEAFTKGEVSPLAELPIQYADYAVWQREYLQGEILKKDLEYWKQQLEDAPPVLALPTDRPRPAIQTYRGATHLMTASPELMSKLKEAARGENSTLFMLLLAAFDVLLQRHTNQKDIVVGAPIAGRNQAETEKLIGFFVNTLVLRAKIVEDESFSDLLGRVKEICLGAYAHQETPFEKLVEELRPERTLSHAPVFQVSFDLQSLRREEMEVKELKLSPLKIGDRATKIDLSLNIIEREQGLFFFAHYNRDLFDAGTIERLMEQYHFLLESGSANTKQLVRDLPLFDQAGLRRMMAERNNTAHDFPHNLCLHHLFESQAARRPEAIAIRCGGEAMSYGELNRRSNQLAHYLRKLGVGLETVVGVSTDRSAEMIVGILGVLKAGGAYLPLDSAHPLDRLAFMQSDAGVAVLLAQEALIDQLPSQWGYVIFLDSDWEKIAAESAENPEVEMASDNLAYVIYTSGSTGQPKGSLLAHRGACNLALAQIESFKLDPASRVLQFASSSFDASVSEIFTALFAGATLCLADRSTLIPGQEMLRLLRDEAISVVTLPPSVLAALPSDELPALKTLVVAGESCTAEIIARWANGRRFINAYGPTEATVCAALCDEVKKESPSVIGTPLRNTEIYILDDCLRPVPIGVAGQMYLGGVGVARGYLNRPELTAENFIPHQYSQTPGARLYRTGDLARYLPDGKIEFLGRVDQQAKIRGFRVEPGEIEASLDTHPAVQQSRVLIREAANGDKRLFAYVVPERVPAASSGEGGNGIELWPSVAEYFVYDEVLYHAMTSDERRNESYKTAFNRLVKDKVVLDIGTGPDAILARFCLEAGAKKVYAIEFLKETYDRAAATLRSLGLENSITLIHGDATKVELPEKVDYCVSEIVGSIGGSEGASVILNNARRFLKDGGAMIPERSVTKIAAVSLPDDFINDPRFTELTGHYVEKIFQQVGYPFDLRLCLKGVDYSHLISNEDVFENLDFRGTTPPEYEHQVSFTITKDARLDGFMVWLTLDTIEGETIDILKNRHCWLPVYFPAFHQEIGHPGISVAAGDRIEARISAQLCGNQLNPDYTVRGRLYRRTGEATDFEYTSYHFKDSYRQHPFYESLFADGLIPIERPVAAAQLTPRVLIDHLKARLPEYMVPASYVFLQSLPLSPNGKVDYSLLPAPELEEAVGNSANEAPRTPTEELLSGIWAQVLGQKTVGIHDNFFELGGHSLLATQVISRIREALQVEVPLRSLFEAKTVAEMAELVDAMRATAGQLEAPPIRPIPRSGPLPLSFAQQRLWFVDQYEPGGAFYNISAAVQLRGHLQVEALEQTLNEIVRRHEVLRTAFIHTDGEPWQVVSPAAPLTLPIIDLCSVPEAERETEAHRLAGIEAARPFDLSAGHLMRISLLRLDAENHIAVFAVHHIVCDGWSMGILVREISMLYTAFANGQPSPLAELPVQYADYAYWQRAWLQGDSLQSQVGYWTQQLSGAPAAIELPLDRPRPLTQTFHGASRVVALPQSLNESLKALSQREGCTNFMTLLAAFQLMLRCYSGNDDIVVGTDVANRNRAEIEGLIGFFVNQLVMRADLSGDPSFRELLTRVREMALGAYAHQDLPFDKLVEAINPERDLSRTPLFQVKMLLQNTPAESLELPELTLRRIEFESGVSRFDMVLSLTESPVGLLALMGYNTDLFDHETINRMLGHLRTVLEQVVATPELRLSQLSLLTPGERAQALVEWNRTEKPYPDDVCLHRLFEAQAARSPEAVAVIFEDRQISYGQLDSRANQLARHLRSLGVGPGALVGVCLERSIEMVVGLLGVLKAGGAYLPMDPAYPLSRLAHLMEDGQPPALLTQERLVERLPAHWGQVICLDTDPDRIAEHSPAKLDFAATADDLAYVIYTSGSTGTPKGVMVSHRSLVHRALSMIENYKFNSASRMLNFVSLGFDALFEEIFPLLASGGSIVILRAPGQTPPLELLRECRRHGVNCLHFPTAYWYQMAEDLSAAGEAVPECIELLITGGESTSISKLLMWAELSRHSSRFINAYGPTETAVTSTMFEVPLDASALSGMVRLPAGRPLANTKIYVLNQERQLLPVGVIGELYIGGTGVAWGYRNKPELTAESFVPNPFGLGGERLYRTGDLSRYLPDGKIEIIGRNDGQVKIRGHRIETGEIVTALERHPAIEKALVVARVDSRGEMGLVAYLLPRAAASPDSSEVRSFIRRSLPEYMVPPSIAILKELPLTPHGKIDHSRLPQVQTDDVAVGGSQEPRTEVERTLCAIWQGVMNINHVGVESSFFDIGGNSLLAIRLMARVRDVFQVELPVRALFESLTVAKLSELIEKEMRAGNFTRTAPLKKASREQRLPLSFAQQRLWFIDQLEPGLPIYNCPGAFRLSGPLRIEILEKSLSEIIKRHEILRTSFSAEQGQPWQVIHPPQRITLPVVDLSGLQEDARDGEINRFAAEEFRQPFNLATGPLLRINILCLGPEEHVILFTLHHIIGDGWSIMLLFREVASLYEAFAGNRPSPLQELTAQYADFACWQQELLKQGELEAELDYWRRQLGGKLPVMRLPFARNRQAGGSHRGARLSFSLPEKTSQRLRDLSRREEATLFMTLLAAFKTLLYRHTHLDDIIVGTAHAGRTRIETESLIGLFINMLALRTDLSGNPTFKELLHRVRRVTLGAFAHQNVPFEKLVEEFHAENRGDHSPIFQVAFGLENLSQLSLDDASQPSLQQLPGLTIAPQKFDSETVRYDLTLWVKDGGDRLSGWWNYSTDVFDAAAISRMQGHFETLLEGILEAPSAHLDDLEMLTAAEKQQRARSEKDAQEAGRRKFINVQPRPIKVAETAQEAQEVSCAD
ncbi:MAG: amino acid adenylation domain-containing protein [Acidobacteriota bacterium]